MSTKNQYRAIKVRHSLGLLQRGVGSTSRSIVIHIDDGSLIGIVVSAARKIVSDRIAVDRKAHGKPARCRGHYVLILISGLRSRGQDAID